jgi:hypothetical protein
LPPPFVGWLPGFEVTVNPVGPPTKLVDDDPAAPPEVVAVALLDIMDVMLAVPLLYPLAPAVALEEALPAMPEERDE